MATYQDVLDGIAKLVGGTAPDPTNRPRWFSGDQTGDGTGIQAGTGFPTFKGCYSTPQIQVLDTPCGMVLPGPFKVTRTPLTNGTEDNTDQVRLLIFVAAYDPETQYTNLNPYRDLVPAVFRAHMTLNSTTLVNWAYISDGRPQIIPWGGVHYDSWEFTVETFRMLNVTYTAP